MAIQKNFTGTCPEHEEDTTVTTKYKEARMLGDPVTYYAYIGHACDIGSFRGCSQESCPLIVD